MKNMFESSGEITEPCPVPFSSIVTIPSSRMPDRNHFWTSRMMALVADPMLQEADNPLLGNFREERSDVGVQYVVHFLAADSDDHCIQRIVLAAVWSEPIREPEEILLVDRAQHRRHGSLDDFVFERRDRERALASVFLRNVAPTDGSARYVPAWTRACSVSILRSRSARRSPMSCRPRRVRRHASSRKTLFSTWRGRHGARAT